MFNRYLVTYDVTDPKRLRRVYKTMRGFGEHLQYSVFRCDLTPVRHVEMTAALIEIIHHDLDQVLIVNLGPVEGASEERIEALGRPYIPAERSAIVI